MANPKDASIKSANLLRNQSSEHQAFQKLDYMNNCIWPRAEGAFKQHQGRLKDLNKVQIGVVTRSRPAVNQDGRTDHGKINDWTLA